MHIGCNNGNIQLSVIGLGNQGRIGLYSINTGIITGDVAQPLYLCIRINRQSTYNPYLKDSFQNSWLKDYK